MKKGKWLDYWKKQTTPKHASESPWFYEELGREVEYFAGGLKGKRVLELGCGDGALIPYLQVDADTYEGVDFSEGLVEKFREQHPEFKVHLQDLFGFLEENTKKYDLIFSYGVMQYFTMSELKDLFKLQNRLLDHDGFCIHLGIPVKELRSVFCSGLGAALAVGVAKKRGWINRLKSLVTNQIGHWHEMDELWQVSNSAGFSTKIRSNISYFYRVNLLQMPQSEK